MAQRTLGGVCWYSVLMRLLITAFSWSCKNLYLPSDLRVWIYESDFSKSALKDATSISPNISPNSLLPSDYNLPLLLSSGKNTSSPKSLWGFLFDDIVRNPSPMAPELVSEYDVVLVGKIKLLLSSPIKKINKWNDPGHELKVWNAFL